jgi:hypothetical protein
LEITLANDRTTMVAMLRIKRRGMITIREAPCVILTLLSYGFFRHLPCDNGDTYAHL